MKRVDKGKNPIDFGKDSRKPPFHSHGMHVGTKVHTKWHSSGAGPKSTGDVKKLQAPGMET